LAEELANAAELFMAAGIDASINRPVLLPVGEAGPLLAWAVREGATNVIRHSRAARCVITVASGDGEARLDIADDGVGCGAAARGSTSSAVATAAGAGLQGLRERLSSAGGRIEAGPRPEGGFRLSVILPMAPAPA
jgi:two-component system sensor histidine kinase DesK